MNKARTRKTSVSIPSDLSASVEKLNDEQLSKELKKLGFNHGPIVPSTIRTLKRYLMKNRNGSSLVQNQKTGIDS